MSTAALVTAIAVCGCGHNGRLGLGPNDANVSKPTLIPQFIPTTAADSSTSATTAAPLPGKVLQVACGGYHTIVSTTEGLFGWGENDVGQLGLGNRTSHVNTPTPLIINGKRIPGRAPATMHSSTTEFANATAARSSDVEEVIRVACGNSHTAILTTEAVYVCGRNNQGQLGLGGGARGGSPDGIGDFVANWQTLCTFAGPNRRNGAFLSLPEAGLDLLSGAVVDVSCGTHHTLLALHDVLTVAHDNVRAVEVWPVMLLACGQGNFGELGYDATAPDVERSRAAARQAAALREAVDESKRIDACADGAVNGLPTGDDSNSLSVPPASSDPLYKFKMKYQAVKRRPPFSSFTPQPVQMPPELEAGPLPFKRDGGEGILSSCNDGAALQAFIEGTREGTQQAKEESRTDGYQLAGGVPHWALHSLHASHLHSAATLRRCGGSHNGGMVSLHWGCYYCNAVEGDAASVPRMLSNADESSSLESTTMAVHVHGGDEICFRYITDHSGKGAASEPVMVMGKGNLGLGEEDSFEESWRPLNGAVTAAVKVTGRHHFLLLLDELPSVSPRTVEREPASAVSDNGGGTVVLGFGENLHGQLTARGTESASGPLEDIVDTPRVILKVGNAIGDGAWVVARVRDVSAGSRHTVFLVDISPATPTDSA